MRRLILPVIGATAWGAPLWAGTIQEFHDDPAGWFAAAGDVTTIDFTGYPDFTEITYQYQDLGVIFPELELIAGYFPKTYVNDGWGLNGVGFIDMDFTSPMTSIAIDHPGTTAFRLYANDRLIFESSFYGGSGTGFFSGLISDTPFDRVQIWDLFDAFVAIDDLHFGPPVPGPATVGLFVTFAFWRRRSRARRRATVDSSPNHKLQ